MYRRVHTKAQRSWAKGLADSPALHFKQRQSRPAAVVQLLAFLWQTPFSLSARRVSFPPLRASYPLTPTANTLLRRGCARKARALRLARGAASPSTTPESLWGCPSPTGHGLGPGAQPRLVPSQLPLQPGPTRTPPVMKTTDKDCTANLSWPSESYLGLNTAKAL